jgi:hypothetical protein
MAMEKKRLEICMKIRLIAPRLVCLLAALLLMSMATLFGQAVSGDIVGTVTDSTGAAVPNATVTAT